MSNETITPQYYFASPIYVHSKKEWVKPLIKATDPHIKEAKKRNAKLIKELKSEFGLSHHSTPLTEDPAFDNFQKFVGNTCAQILMSQGFDLDKSTNTINQDGLIYTRSDKGFQFTNDEDSGKTLSIKLHNAAKTLSQVFTLNPGDTMSRDGGYSTVVVVPKGGTEEVDGVVTVIPWMDGWRSSDPDATADNGNKKFSYDMGGSGNGTHGYHVEVLPAAEYVIPNAGNGGSDNGGSDNGDNGDNGDDGDDTEEGPNYLLYGGGLALLVVGGIMASKMLKK